MATLTPETVVKKSDEVFVGDVDGETVAMNIQTGKYYHLNGTGSRIFLLLEEEHSVRALCEKLKPGYRVDDAALGEDVLEFVQTMEGFGLVEVG